jgi:hypothetical protein
VAPCALSFEDAIVGGAEAVKSDLAPGWELGMNPAADKGTGPRGLSPSSSSSPYRSS